MENIQMTREQCESLDAMDSSVKSIQSLVQDQSVCGVIESRIANQIMKAVNIMYTDIKNAILDLPVERSDDKIIFVRDSLNLLNANFIINASVKPIQDLTQEFAQFVSNYSEVHGDVKDLDSAARSARISVDTRNSFEMLVNRSEALSRQLLRVENSVKVSPNIAAHFMKVIRDDLGK